MIEANIRQFAKDNFVPIVRPKTSELLIEKVKEIGPSSILEIGTAIGYSGILMLQNSNAFLTTLEKDEKMQELATQNFAKEGLLGRVSLIFGDAFDYIEKEPQKFDFIFLDGPKGQYAKYLPHLVNMLSNDGLLFCDNVLFGGLVKTEGEIPKKHRTIVNNLRKFLEMAEKDESLESEVLDIEDGICLIRKKQK
ncbi:MAG: O-methyltransferase [Christensenellales bacterium]